MAFISNYWLLDVFGLIAAGFAIIYAYFRHNFQYWRKRGFPSPLEPSFPYGNFYEMSRTKPMEIILADAYTAAGDERFFGCYLFTKPLLVIKDLDLVKDILIRDFSHFHDRGFPELNLERNPLGAHLVLLNGQEWRNLRTKLTPTFTSGKMKMMFPTFIEVGQHLTQVLDEASKDDETEVKDILSRYTTDVISSVAFGVETNSLKNPDVDFRKMGNEIAKMSQVGLAQLILIIVMNIYPKWIKYIPMSFIPDHITKFFINLVRDTMKYRLQNDVQRKDFMQLLIQLKTFGFIKDVDNPAKDLDEPENQQKFTYELAAAQAFLFFIAGFETTSSTMQFALYELAVNPDLQKEAQQEMEATNLKHNGLVSYEALQEMDLLDRIVSETLRKYPVAANLVRECTKEYKIPGTDLTIQPKDNLWFPVFGYHRDPKYFPDPEKFDPDRFLPEIKETRPQHAYLPFGDGPRSCIGNRFALMQIKAGLALVLSRFTISPSKNTPIPMVFDPKSTTLAPKGKMHLNISKREHL